MAMHACRLRLRRAFFLLFFSMYQLPVFSLGDPVAQMGV
jgi:hypothetical protein